MKKRRLRRLKQKNKYRPFLILILLSFFIVYSFIYVDKEIRPVVEVLSEIEATIVGTQAINEGVSTALQKGIRYDDLLEVVKDEKGNVNLIQANTIAMNILSSDITTLVQEKIETRSQQPIKIPLGNVLRSQILAHYGPKLSVEILPVGAIEVDFFSEFEEAGINQTIHRVYVRVDTKIHIIVPLSNKSVQVSGNVPIAETVIVGDVPNTYINMPSVNKEDLFHYIR